VIPQGFGIPIKSTSSATMITFSCMIGLESHLNSPSKDTLVKLSGYSRRLRRQLLRTVFTDWSSELKEIANRPRLIVHNLGIGLSTQIRTTHPLMPPHPARPPLFTGGFGPGHKAWHLIWDCPVKGHKDFVEVPEAAYYKKGDERPHY